MKHIVVGPRGSGRTEALLDMWLESINQHPNDVSLFVTHTVMERDRIRRDVSRTVTLTPRNSGLVDLIVCFGHLRESRFRGVPNLYVFIDNAETIIERELGFPIEGCAMQVDEQFVHTGVAQNGHAVIRTDKCPHCEEIAQKFGTIRGEEEIPEFIK